MKKVTIIISIVLLVGLSLAMLYMQANSSKTEPVETAEEARPEVTSNEGTINYKGASYKYSILPTGRVYVASLWQVLPKEKEAVDVVTRELLRATYGDKISDAAAKKVVRNGLTWDTYTDKDGKEYYTAAYQADGGIREVRYYTD